MKFKSWWKKLKYWQKWAIGFIIPNVILAIIFYLSFALGLIFKSELIGSIMLILLWGVYSWAYLPILLAILIISSGLTLLSIDTSNRLFITIFYIILPIIGTLFYGCIGALIGLLIQKYKKKR